MFQNHHSTKVPLLGFGLWSYCPMNTACANMTEGFHFINAKVPGHFYAKAEIMQIKRFDR